MQTEIIEIKLPANLAVILQKEIDTGSYSSAGEILAEAFTVWHQKKEASRNIIRQLCQEGLESGRSSYNNIDEIITVAKQRKEARKGA